MQDVEADSTRSHPVGWRRRVVTAGDGPGLLEAVWRYRWTVAATTLMAATLGFGLSQLQTPMYAAEARLLLGDPREASAFGEENANLVVGDGSRYVRKQAEYLASTQVLQRASDLLDGRIPPAVLDDRTTVRPSEELDLITIGVLAPDPQLAADAANALAQGYEDVRTEEVRSRADARIQQLESNRTALLDRLEAVDEQLRLNPQDATAGAEQLASQEQLVTLVNRISQISTDATLYGSGVEFFEPAAAPTIPARPRPVRSAAVAAVVGLLVSAALSWRSAARASSADEPAQAGAVLGVPLLGTVPDFGRLSVADVLRDDRPASFAIRESYQSIITTLEVSQQDWDARSILVTSAGSGDGKTSTALNLAVAAIRDGRRVLLVDADGRARALSRLAGVEHRPGLADLRHDDATVDEMTVDWSITDDLTVPLIPAGEPLSDSAAVYRSAPFRRGVKQLASSADLVVIDTVPVLALADTVAIAGQCDGTILVVTRGTPLRLLDELKERLELVGTPVLGFVFNRATDTWGVRYATQRAYAPRPSRQAAERGRSGSRAAVHAKSDA